MTRCVLSPTKTAQHCSRLRPGVQGPGPALRLLTDQLSFPRGPPRTRRRVILSAVATTAATGTSVGYGFWLFLLSDIILFAALFATYAVLSGSTADGPGGAELFDKKHVFQETICLLASSVTCGFGSLAEAFQLHREVPPCQATRDGIR